MKIRGDKVKMYRKKSGLSQTQLAQGICTQATISLIEKNSQLPSMPILFEICTRLGIDVQDVIETGNHELTNIFTQIDQAVLSEDDQTAANLLNSIRIKQLRTTHDKQRYYYFLGMLQLMQNGDPDEALFNFNLALKQFAAQDTDIYQVLATVAAGMANLKKGDQRAARDLANRGTQMAQKTLVGASSQQLISLNLKLAELNLKVDRLQESLQHAQQVVALCRQFETLFAIDQGFFQLAIVQQATGDLESARQNIQIAESLSIVCEHSKLLAAVRQRRMQLRTISG